jgi:hypothetical protein
MAHGAAGRLPGRAQRFANRSLRDRPHSGGDDWGGADDKAYAAFQVKPAAPPAIAEAASNLARVECKSCCSSRSDRDQRECPLGAALFAAMPREVTVLAPLPRGPTAQCTAVHA